MSLKLLHLENKATREHTYYGSMAALLLANPELPYYTVRRVKTFPYERDDYIIRDGERETKSDVIARKNNA